MVVSMSILCDRCKREVYRYERCNYCLRNVCVSCEKSSQRIKKTMRMVICKDCWGDMRKRGAFKNRKAEVQEEEA
jgi:hypothetical protein